MLLRRSRSFTLIELLVVVAIIALLLAIILPSLSNARQSALRVACVTKLRDLSIASSYYAQDNEGYLPCGYYTSGYGVNLFTNQLYPQYLDVVVTGGSLGGDLWRSYFRCPAVKGEPPSRFRDGYRWPVGPSNYFGNVYALGTSGDGMWREAFRPRARYTSYQRPADILMYGDTADAGPRADATWEARVVPAIPPPASLNGINSINFFPDLMARHVGLCNVSYVDGHCGALTADQLIANDNDLWAQTSR